MDKLKMHTPNLVDGNIEKIAELFPNCITEAQNEQGELIKALTLTYYDKNYPNP